MWYLIFTTFVRYENDIHISTKTVHSVAKTTQKYHTNQFNIYSKISLKLFYMSSPPAPRLNTINNCFVQKIATEIQSIIKSLFYFLFQKNDRSQTSNTYSTVE